MPLDSGLAQRIRGRPIRGWVRPPVTVDDAALGAWVRRGLAHARTLG